MQQEFSRSGLSASQKQMEELPFRLTRALAEEPVNEKTKACVYRAYHIKILILNCSFPTDATYLQMLA